MKRILYITLLATAALFGCAKEEAVPTPSQPAPTVYFTIDGTPSHDVPGQPSGWLYFAGYPSLNIWTQVGTLSLGLDAMTTGTDTVGITASARLISSIPPAVYTGISGTVTIDSIGTDERLFGSFQTTLVCPQISDTITISSGSFQGYPRYYPQ